METLEIEVLQLGAQKLLTRNEIRQVINLNHTTVYDGSTGTCHYNCVYDDAMGNPHTYAYTGGTCSTASDCATNNSPCITLANGHDWVVSKSCS